MQFKMDEQPLAMRSLTYCRYSRHEKRSFANYFIREPAKRGRPRKKSKLAKNKLKRKRRRLKKQRKKCAKVLANIVEKQQTLKAVGVELAGLEAQAETKQAPLKRINWDLPENAKRRTLLADAWEDKTEPYYQAGDSFTKFCKSNGIDRGVLSRFIKRRKDEQPPKKRGRPSLLSEDVWRHLCERK